MSGKITGDGQLRKLCRGYPHPHRQRDWSGTQITTAAARREEEGWSGSGPPRWHRRPPGPSRPPAGKEGRGSGRAAPRANPQAPRNRSAAPAGPPAAPAPSCSVATSGLWSESCDHSASDGGGGRPARPWAPPTLALWMGASASSARGNTAAAFAWTLPRSSTKSAQICSSRWVRCVARASAPRASAKAERQPSLLKACRARSSSAEALAFMSPTITSAASKGSSPCLLAKA
mmetsp:Transcript_50732/g.157100  ORF Transcript_50732/g.157100 Transcript_50732/m.157100 type:complete len:232 (-) Transcript_50732:638-1333(-)